MRIYIMRHGQTSLNKHDLINGQIDDVLTEEGREQANAAKSTVPETIRRIYSSSLSRARETAEIVNQELGLPLTFHDEIREVDFGTLSGTPFHKELKDKHMAVDYDWSEYGGENVEAVKQRVTKLLREIRDNEKSDEVLLVAHGGIVRLLHFLQHGEAPGIIPNASIHSYDLDSILN